MSPESSAFIATIVLYFGTWLLVTWGFDLQFGLARVVNLGTMVPFAAGAYVAGVLAIGANAPGQSYFFGANLAFPIPLLAGAAAGALSSAGMGLVTAWRLREEHLAIATLVISVGLWNVVGNVQGIFNGDAGISGVPEPIGHTILPTTTQLWEFAGLTIAICVVAGVFVRRLYSAPISRVLRAVRERPQAAENLGIATAKAKLGVMALGGLLGGLAGALLVEGIGAWNTSAWQVFEMLVILAATAIGGPGNWRGVMLGVFLIPIVIGEGITYLPSGGSGAVTYNLEFVIVGIIEIVVLAVRPDGILKERLRRYDSDGRVRLVGSRDGPMGRLIGLIEVFGRPKEGYEVLPLRDVVREQEADPVRGPSSGT